MVTVLVAHACPLMRAGLRAGLTHAGDLELVGEASRGVGVFHLLRRVRPDVLLLGCRLKGTADVVTVARHVCGLGARPSVLAWDYAGDDGLLWRLLQAGAVGCLEQGVSPEVLIEAVRSAARGGRLWTGEQAGRARAWWERIGSRLESLTPRERQVLSLVAEGWTTRGIADRLVLSRNTIQSHVRSALTKLGVRSRLEAAVLLVRELDACGACQNH